jgi:uncharacterized protein (DUF433 family)
MGCRRYPYGFFRLWYNTVWLIQAKEGTFVNHHSVIVRDPEILWGTPVFAGTRVPVQTLLDYLAAGDSVSEFLEQYPSVRPEQVAELLGYFHEVIEQVA